MQQQKQCDLNDMVKHQSKGLSGNADKKPLLVRHQERKTLGYMIYMCCVEAREGESARMRRARTSIQARTPLGYTYYFTR